VETFSHVFPLMMSGVPLETCRTFDKLWNNKFCYKLHLVGISTESYYDARIHEYKKIEDLFYAIAEA